MDTTKLITAVRALDILTAWLNDYFEAQDQMIEDESGPDAFSHYLSENHPHNADLLQILNSVSNRMIGLNEEDVRSETLAHKIAYERYLVWIENLA